MASLDDLKRHAMEHNPYLKEHWESKDYNLGLQVTAKCLLLNLTQEDLANLLDVDVEKVIHMQIGKKVEDGLLDQTLDLLDKLESEKKT